MLVNKAYKFRIYPNKAQETLIAKTIGCSRFVFNFALAQQKKQDKYWSITQEMVNKGQLAVNKWKSPYFNKYQAIKDIPKRKKNYAWLKEVDSIALQSAVENVGSAYDKYYKKQNNEPIFKSKRNKVQSYTTKCVNNNIAIVDNKIKLPKLGLVKFAKSREVEDRILNVTIRRNPSGKYFVSILVETDVQPLEKTGSSVGVDLGLKDFAILSDGTPPYENPKWLRTLEDKLAKAQRILSRRKVGGANWNKQRIKVARIHFGFSQVVVQYNAK